MKDRVVKPARAIAGTVQVPGDKSISHRLAMLTALAAGESVLTGFLCSEDCLNTLAAVEALGAHVHRDDTRVVIEGTGGLFRPPQSVLDMGNSGTGMRLLAGLLAGHAFESVLTGDASLRSRPMKRIQTPLERLGAGIVLEGENGAAPMRIKGGRLRGVDYTLPMASAQVKSCVLLAGLYADGRTSVTEPKPTRDHTERLLRAMGVDCETDGLRTVMSGGHPGGAVLGAGRTWSVPGDFSSAAFWITAAAAMPGAAVTLCGVGLNPRRTALLDVLRRMGASIDIAPADSPDTWEPVGDIHVRGSALTGTDVGGAEIPNLIDELPLVAVAGALAAGTTRIRDAAELRLKESDRIQTVAEGLGVFGVPVEQSPDGMRVQGGGPIRGGGTVQSHGDHRIAMSMAVLALAAEREVRIENVACVQTSYPEFWDHLLALSTQER